MRGQFERSRRGERQLAVFCGRAEMALTKRNPRAHATHENRGRHPTRLNRTAQRLVCSLRIVDQQVRTRQIRTDLFAGYTEIDASVDLVEGSLPAFEAGPLRALHDELVQTDDVEQRDVFIAGRWSASSARSARSNHAWASSHRQHNESANAHLSIREVSPAM